MSERIVDNPANHGWVEENGKWVWDGKREVELEAGNAEGQITTWDGGKWTPDNEVKVSSSGISSGLTGSYEAIQITTSGNASPLFVSNAPSGTVEMGFRESTQEGCIGTTSNHPLQLFAGGASAVTIDATGDATFSGGVTINSTCTRVSSSPNYRMTLSDNSRSWDMLVKPTGELNFLDRTAGADRLTIDATGNATFSGQVSLAENTRINSTSTTAVYETAPSGSSEFVSLSSAPFIWRIGSYSNADKVLEIDATGDATFSGNVSANAHIASTFQTQVDGASIVTFYGRTIYSEASTGVGFHFGANTGTILPCRGTDGATTDGVVSLGNNSKRFNHLFIKGSVLNGGGFYQNDGEAVLSVNVLLDAFKSLRAATADETSVESLRDSIGNCLGGLIEKLETIQADATADIERMVEATSAEDEPLPQVSTMDL